ncbi:MAG: Sua5/YciO/YrdC/YwlC family protein [Candidatus Magasanikbacteria bacterium GW2011_GWC2_40_17]|uniref:L-threonylcarbamoyladenylate synthase n=1 Tax=Candidatus Magasanikbacteria bacterium GW2011_GWA2_42_32 TaxID=1619039 RepID=A0A0G1A887_9BACT|nr:MAG: Sua5/YciO/YrdC/YwlC family protein [Candidatus Magasanikbacteria bacterium GW2011_GWC2_40_17]KKS57245.1 MAG: Sua5/YciO/YrdC/YwlC family protein [Candidatus Magasanikbacteria bacterium GW2011_GWA2_42_32]OGH86135.1 MAG: threonylcarbamoyl-AMP synthase [Candidatus Magasanikbacteria bacterium RIFOXYB2_FULL_38_10]
MIIVKKLKEAVDFLKKGGVIIYPTETAYGLGCDSTNQEALDLIFKIKQRPQAKTLPLIAGSLAMVKKWVILNKQEEILAKKYWPGALTLVLKNKKEVGLSKSVVAKDNTVAIRISSNKIARTLAQRLGRPIVSTSANISGAKEIYSVTDLKKSFKKLSTDCIYTVDGGVLKRRAPSTVARIRNGKIEVLRQGGLKIT